MAGVRRAISREQEPDAAAAQLAGLLMQPGCCLVLLFVAPVFDMTRLAAALGRHFPGVQLAGCTTAGEIGPGGYADSTIVGVSFAAPDFAARIGVIEHLSRKNVADMQAQVRGTRLAIADAVPWARHENLFALSLVDGMCGCEEVVANAACGALGGIPLCGGSAGDAMHFEKTFVLQGGVFRRDCAVIIVVATRRRFRAFKTEHILAGSERIVVTGANPALRVVTEINAEPAAAEYARIVGIDPSLLTASVFATYPMVVRIGEQIFVRSIQRVNPDLSLTFFCAIDEGVVLTVGRSGDLLASLQARFAGLSADLGKPEVVIGFDCILRGLELEQRQGKRLAGTVLDANNVVGFSTYGEQYEAMHVNQTFTGVAIGQAHA